MIKILKRFWWLLPLALVMAALGFAAWGLIVPAPMSEALSALQSDAQVSVENEPWLVFRPRGQEPTTGFIIYPGGRVDPRAYAPAAHTIAAQDYLVVITPMPINLAVLAPDKASEVIAAFPSVRRWAIGGHSLGGAMAARFVYQRPNAAQGLVLWAAYPADTDSLAAANIAVVSIYGTRDGLVTGPKLEASRKLLPATTRWVAIAGGNHAQFGWYGLQDGDNPATISREAQQAQMADATLQLLKELQH